MSRTILYPIGTWILWTLALPLAVLTVGMVVVARTDVGDLPFDNSHLWWLGAAVPLAGLLSIYGTLRRRRAVSRFAAEEIVPLLTRRVSSVRPAIRAGLVVLAVLMIVAAIIGPRWGVYMERQKVRGVDVVAALDVSRSMLAEDIRPNRLERAKDEIRHQLTERPVFRHANRLALLAFAGSTSLRVPLTTDHLNFRAKLAALQFGVVPRGGTAIAEAILAAVDLLARSPEQATKVILLFTDGEDTSGGEPIEAARKAYTEKGIRVFTIGVGDPARTVGTEVPAGTAGDRKPMLHEGQIVFSKLDVAGLRQIAEAGGGEYAPLEDLHVLVNAISGMWKMELTTEERRRHKPQYQWFLAAALALLGMNTIMAEHRSSGDAGVTQRTWQQEAA